MYSYRDEVYGTGLFNKNIRDGFVIIDLFSFCFLFLFKLQVTIVDNVMQVMNLNLSDQNTYPFILKNFNSVKETVAQHSG